MSAPNASLLLYGLLVSVYAIWQKLKNITLRVQLEREEWVSESLRTYIDTRGARNLSPEQARKLLDAIRRHGKPSPASFSTVDDLIGTRIAEGRE